MTATCFVRHSSSDRVRKISASALPGYVERGFVECDPEGEAVTSEAKAPKGKKAASKEASGELTETQESPDGGDE